MPEVIDLTSSSPNGSRQARRASNGTVSSPPPSQRTLRRRSPFRSGRSRWGTYGQSDRSTPASHQQDDISFDSRLPVLELNSPGQELSPEHLAGRIREIERILLNDSYDRYGSSDYGGVERSPSLPSPPAAVHPIASRPRRSSNPNHEDTATSSRQAQATSKPMSTTQRKRARAHSTEEEEEEEEEEGNEGKPNKISKPPPKKPSMDIKPEIVDMVDVEDDDDVQKIVQQQMLKAQREEGNARRKIADFNCVICLDEPTNLSTTPCGHLFCNECIKTTLRFGNPQAKFGKCPVCRGKVNLKDIVPLELRLLKFKGKGKGKA